MIRTAALSGEESPDFTERGIRRKAEVRRKADTESGTETRYGPE